MRKLDYRQADISKNIPKLPKNIFLTDPYIRLFDYRLTDTSKNNSKTTKNLITGRQIFPKAFQNYQKSFFGLIHMSDNWITDKQILPKIIPKLPKKRFWTQRTLKFHIWRNLDNLNFDSIQHSPYLEIRKIRWLVLPKMSHVR